MKIRITKPVYMFPEIEIGEIYEAREDRDGDFWISGVDGGVLVYSEECEVIEESEKVVTSIDRGEDGILVATVEDSEESWIEALFKELSRLGCYDIKFEKDSKFHTEFSIWSEAVASPITIIQDKSLPTNIVNGAKLRGVNVEIVDRSFEKVITKPKEELYQITFMGKDSELNFVGVGSPRVEGLDVYIMSPDNKQAVVDKSKFLYFIIEPYNED